MLTKINISVTNYEIMKEFYSKVFELKFNEVSLGEFSMATVKMDSISLTLVPIEISGVSADVNNIQLGFELSNLESILNLVEKYKGKIKDPLQVSGNSKYAGIYDPDGNTIELLEKPAE